MKPLKWKQNADKTFPLKSMELSSQLGAVLLKAIHS